jgi:hypothetical protein
MDDPRFPDSTLSWSGLLTEDHDFEVIYERGFLGRIKSWLP